MPSQQPKLKQQEDLQLTEQEARLRKTLSANLSEGLALSEFASTLPEREGMSEAEILEAFRAAQLSGERED